MGINKGKVYEVSSIIGGGNGRGRGRADWSMKSSKRLGGRHCCCDCDCVLSLSFEALVVGSHGISVIVVYSGWW